MQTAQKILFFSLNVDLNFQVSILIEYEFI